MARCIANARLLALLVFASSNLGVASAADLDDVDQLEAYIDGVVKLSMKGFNSASGVVAITRGGEVVLSKGYGYQDIDARLPVDPESTLFRIGSVSKLFTWVSVMQLAERGLLDLDTDINQYLKTFQIDDTYDQPITLRHIMTHTAGFEDGALGYLIVVDEEKILPPAEAMKKYQPMRVNPPGTQSSYSNYATALAGLIVANVSGMSFNDYVKTNIFDVLGMNDSTFEEPLPSHLENQMAGGYVAENGNYVAKPFELVASFGPAGAMSSPASDMTRFALAVLNGGELDGARILSADTMRHMLMRNYSQDDRLAGMALGFYETEDNGVRLVGHGGDTFLFHTDLAIDLENDISIYTSFTGEGGSTVRATIVPAFYKQYFPSSEEPPAVPDDFADRAPRYAGIYQFWRHNFSTIEKALMLAPAITVAPTEENTLILSFAGGSKQFVEVDKNLFRELNQDIALSERFSPRLLAFQEDEDGSIKGMVIDGLPFMTLFKSPACYNSTMNFFLLGLSIIVFIGVLLRLAYQWSALRAMPEADRSAARASVYVAVSNLVFLVVALLVVSSYGTELFNGLPFAFKAMLVLPIIAFVAGLFHAYKLVGVWRKGLLGSAWARVRYGVVTLSALFMCWFYYFWNILGFQYLG